MCAAHLRLYWNEIHRWLWAQKIGGQWKTNKTYVCHISLQRRITLKWNLFKLYTGKSSGSQVWEVQPCEGGRAHQDLRDDEIHHLHADPPSTLMRGWKVKVCNTSIEQKLFGGRWERQMKSEYSGCRRRRRSEAGLVEIRWGGGGRWCNTCHSTRVLCVHTGC